LDHLTLALLPPYVSSCVNIIDFPKQNKDPQQSKDPSDLQEAFNSIIIVFNSQIEADKEDRKHDHNYISDVPTVLEVQLSKGIGVEADIDHENKQDHQFHDEKSFFSLFI
jgi:hypothetical protein